MSEANNVPKAEGGIIDIQLLFYPPPQGFAQLPPQTGGAKGKILRICKFPSKFHRLSLSISGRHSPFCRK
ncbi:hypothetical protein HPSSW114_0326 [Glaesserella parasuis SW114]|nr:hypothetical protein HPSSW114_0326 [Glaesserella parasuis SW114]